MADNKRFARYPSLAARIRSYTDDQRMAVRGFHHAMIDGLRSFLQAWPSEAKSLGLDVTGGQSALGAWLRTQEDVAGVITDPREADWCCARGMAAWPEPCPQHVRIVMTPEDVPMGTVLRSPGTTKGPKESFLAREYTVPGLLAIKVLDKTPGSVGHHWRGIHHAIMFDDDNVRGWHWAGEVKSGV